MLLRVISRCPRQLRSKQHLRPSFLAVAQPFPALLLGFSSQRPLLALSELREGRLCELCVKSFFPIQKQKARKPFRPRATNSKDAHFSVANAPSTPVTLHPAFQQAVSY